MSDKTEHLIFHGDAFDGVVSSWVRSYSLVICDPPYGKIVKNKWDVANYNQWMKYCVSMCRKSATIIMWGGVGKRQDRPFIRFAADVEWEFPEWEIKPWLTWGKRRAYGTDDNYLFTREECLILRRDEPTFNVPLLDKERGYAGYNKKYPAKSKFLRVTDVWTDITEIFKGKIHPCQKPEALYRRLVETHSNPGDWVLDPCAGSLTTHRVCKEIGRNSVCIEKEMEYIQRADVCVLT